MDVIEFFGELKNMTMDCTIGCDHCPMSAFRNGNGVSCTTYIQNHTAEAVAIVERWKHKLPAECRQTEALKAFPDLPINPDTGIIDVSPCDIDRHFHGRSCPKNVTDCENCLREYWTEATI